MKKLRKMEFCICGQVAFVPVYYKGKIIKSEISTLDAKEVGKYLWSSNGKYVSGSAGYLHRLIMNPKKGQQIDHIDGNPFNNKRSNLRVVTNQQNQMARHKAVGISGHKGVYSVNKKWRAVIKKDGKLIHIGYFDTKELASYNYNLMAKKLFGIYAVENRKD